MLRVRGKTYPQTNLLTAVLEPLRVQMNALVTFPFVYEMGSFQQFHRHPEFQYGGLKPDIILFETNCTDGSVNLCSYGS